MDVLAIRIGVPAVVGVGKTTVIDEADGRVDATNWGFWAAGQSVRFDNPAEWVLAGKIVVEREELSLLGL